MSAIMNKIPQFNEVTGYMEKAGMPMPTLMLIGAIVFLLAGSASVVLGFKARLGAVLLFVFLALANYYFHNFWDIADPEKQQAEMGNFMKNVALMGAFLVIMANGVGRWSLDAMAQKPAS
jgi:putative oxidoreductase